MRIGVGRWRSRTSRAVGLEAGCITASLSSRWLARHHHAARRHSAKAARGGRASRQYTIPRNSPVATPRAVRRDHEPRRGDAKRARLPVVLHDLPPASPRTPPCKVLTVSCGTRACQCLCLCLLRKVLTVSCELNPATNLSILSDSIFIVLTGDR